MKYKLLVLDIDGTVTNSKKQITEKTRNAILELQKAEFRWQLRQEEHLREFILLPKHWNLINLKLYYAF